MKLIIIGSSHGIGKFLADNLSEHEIIRVSRTVHEHDFYQADVTDAKSMISCADYVKNKWGHIDGLIYCAGTLGDIGPAMSMDPISWANTMNVNLNGFFNSVHAFYDLLKCVSIPKIIAFSGGGATKGRPGFSAYATSKCGLVRLVETLSGELPSFRINAIAPGSILTDMTRKVIEAGPDVIGQKEYEDALKTNKIPTEALELTRYLLSDDGNRISGRLIAAIWDDWRRQDCYSGDAGYLRRIEPK